MTCELYLKKGQPDIPAYGIISGNNKVVKLGLVLMNSDTDISNYSYADRFINDNGKWY